MKNMEKSFSFSIIVSDLLTTEISSAVLLKLNSFALSTVKRPSTLLDFAIPLAPRAFKSENTLTVGLVCFSSSFSISENSLSSIELITLPLSSVIETT